jgi:cytochrome c553
VVASGEGKATHGCASCHLASGSGHPESANLTGLTADYMLAQIHDFQQGLRTDPRHRMSEIAKGMTEEEAKEASAYFARQKPRPWTWTARHARKSRSSSSAHGLDGALSVVDLGHDRTRWVCMIPTLKAFFATAIFQQGKLSTFCQVQGAP